MRHAISRTLDTQGPQQVSAEGETQTITTRLRPKRRETATMSIHDPLRGELRSILVETEELTIYNATPPPRVSAELSARNNELSMDQSRVSRGTQPSLLNGKDIGPMKGHKIFNCGEIRQQRAGVDMDHSEDPTTEDPRGRRSQRRARLG